MLSNFFVMFWNLFQGIDFACKKIKSHFKKAASVHRSPSQWQRSYVGTIKLFRMRLLKFVLFALDRGHGIKLYKHLQSIGRPLFSMQKSICIERDQKTTKIILCYHFPAAAALEKWRGGQPLRSKLSQ